jgi:hypothetical protein
MARESERKTFVGGGVTVIFVVAGEHVYLLGPNATIIFRYTYIPAHIAHERDRSEQAVAEMKKKGL